VLIAPTAWPPAAMVLACTGDDPGREVGRAVPPANLGVEAEGRRQVIAVMRERLAAGQAVARMYQEPGLVWLERRPRPLRS
jgi:hypothetical protein